MHLHANVILHEDNNIACQEDWQISLFAKAHEITRCREISQQDGRYAVQAGKTVQQAAGLGNRHGGIMRIGRTLIIPAILALGVAGSILSGSAMSAAAAHAPSVHVQVIAASVGHDTYYHT